MARPKHPDPVTTAREAALDGLGEPAAPDDAAPEAAPVARKPRPIEPSVAALFPSGAVLLHELLAAAQKAWRDAVDRETPSLDRLATAGVARVDADAASGYLAVVTAEDTWRAFVAREQLATIVALLVRRPIEEVARELGRGPGAIAPAPETP